MFIGVATVELYISEAFSLKDKRRVLKSIIAKVKGKFNVSLAEVDFNDNWNKALLGITCVSSDSSHIDSMLNNTVNFIEKEGWSEVVDYQTEIIKY